MTFFCNVPLYICIVGPNLDCVQRPTNQIGSNPDLMNRTRTGSSPPHWHHVGSAHRHHVGLAYGTRRPNITGTTPTRRNWHHTGPTHQRLSDRYTDTARLVNQRPLAWQISAYRPNSTHRSKEKTTRNMPTHSSTRKLKHFPSHEVRTTTSDSYTHISYKLLIMWTNVSGK